MTNSQDPASSTSEDITCEVLRKNLGGVNGRVDPNAFWKAVTTGINNRDYVELEHAADIAEDVVFRILEWRQFQGEERRWDEVLLNTRQLLEIHLKGCGLLVEKDINTIRLLQRMLHHACRERENFDRDKGRLMPSMRRTYISQQAVTGEILICSELESYYHTVSGPSRITEAQHAEEVRKAKPRFTKRDVERKVIEAEYSVTLQKTDLTAHLFRRAGGAFSSGSTFNDEIMQQLVSWPFFVKLSDNNADQYGDNDYVSVVFSAEQARDEFAEWIDKKARENDDDLIDLTLVFCRRIKNGRRISHVLSAILDETHELMDEVEKKINHKKAGPDAILGEGIDVIVSTLDMIYMVHPDITKEQIMAMALKKLEKWERRYGHCVEGDRSIA